MIVNASILYTNQDYTNQHMKVSVDFIVSTVEKIVKKYLDLSACILMWKKQD